MKSPPTPVPQPDAFPEVTGQPASTTTSAGDTESQSLYTLIAEQPFFKGLNPQQLQLLTDSAMEMRFDAEQEILQEGSPANRFYLILEGKVVLESALSERDMIPIQTLGPGDDLGWSWLFPPYLLNSSARALDPTRTIFFYGTRLREQCEQDPALGFQLMQRVAGVVIQRLQVTQQRLTECVRTSKLPGG